MPTYTYKCTECEKVSELVQKMSDDPLTDCPECGKPVKKVITGGACFILKGNGWYQTDFKDQTKKSAEK